MDFEALLEYAAQYGDTGVNAGAVSEYFGVWRNNASAALNSLVQDGKLLKINGRPVRYAIPTASQAPEEVVPPIREAFSSIIGHNGSLKFQTQMARAAVAYPPYGIHTLIIGETGVGKSLMAAEMGNFLKSIRGKTAGEVPFVVFNCAEYSDNPQLLLSELFGYVKGAFTGADSDKAGLVERANGGILFLDEIHRLPATGQEMFFTVVDRGSYRRLGDTQDREVRFMLIGATTEAPDNFLLNTFKRRMPMTIQIPVLSERPINERLDIVTHFLYEESCRLNVTLRISYLALKILTSFRGENNIGDLKNEIQIACARAHLDRMSPESKTASKDFLSIDIYNLSRKLSVNYMADEKVDQYFSAIGLKDTLDISPQVPPAPSPAAGDSFRFETDVGLDDQVLSYRSSLSEQPISGEQPALQRDTAESQKVLYGSIAPNIWSTTNELIRYATVEFSKTYGPDMVSSVAYYLQQLKSYADAGRIIFSPTNFEKEDAFPREKHFVKKMAPLLRNRLNIDIMDGEATLLAALLAYESAAPIEPNHHLLLVGYGQVASSVAIHANKLLNVHFIKAFDIDDETDTETIHFRLTELLEDDAHDTLILSALGTVPLLKNVLQKLSAKCHYRIIPLLDTMLALECGRMILFSQDSIDEIVRKLGAECEEYFHLSLQAFTDEDASERPSVPAKDEHSVDMRDVIITYCVTGTGSARMAREILRRDFSVSSTADILPLGIMDDIASITKRLGKRLKLVIGVINPNIAGIPFISIEQLLHAEDLNKLLQTKGILLPADLEMEVQEVTQMTLGERLALCQEYLDYFAPSVDPTKADKAARSIIRKIGDMYQAPMLPDLAVRLYIHCTTMFERITTADPVPIPLDGYAAIEHYADLFQSLKRILCSACKDLHIEIGDAEIYYLMMTLPDIETL